MGKITSGAASAGDPVSKVLYGQFTMVCVFMCIIELTCMCASLSLHACVHTLVVHVCIH